MNKFLSKVLLAVVLSSGATLPLSGVFSQELQVVEAPAEIYMVRIPAGSFTMGANESAEIVAQKSSLTASEFKAESPSHSITITRDFFMSQTEITQGQYLKIMGKNPSYFSPSGKGKELVSGVQTEQLPVDTVSWFDAVAFCNTLSEKAGLKAYYQLDDTKMGNLNIVDAKVTIAGGQGFRLPTEAEWEYACRAGSTTTFSLGDNLSSLQANFDGKQPYGDAKRGPHLRRTAAVKSYEPNSFGLYDMHGNLWEHCEDVYSSSYYGKSPKEDPTGPTFGKERVIRGGCYYGPAYLCRSAHRSRYEPTFQPSNVLGFRIVRSYR